MGFLERHLGGHVSIGRRIVIYGFNAMHVAVNIQTERWGYICFHPTVRCFGTWWPWYFYVSPNATPWAATFAAGPGFDGERRLVAVRRRELGHNFDAESCRPELCRINGYSS